MFLGMRCFPSSTSPVYWPLSVVLCLFFVLILALVRFRTQFNLISIALLPCPLIFVHFASVYPFKPVLAFRVDKGSRSTLFPFFLFQGEWVT